MYMYIIGLTEWVQFASGTIKLLNAKAAGAWRRQPRGHIIVTCLVKRARKTSYTRISYNVAKQEVSCGLSSLAIFQ